MFVFCFKTNRCRKVFNMKTSSPNHHCLLLCFLRWVGPGAGCSADIEAGKPEEQRNETWLSVPLLISSQRSHSWPEKQWASQYDDWCFWLVKLRPEQAIWADGSLIEVLPGRFRDCCSKMYQCNCVYHVAIMAWVTAMDARKVRVTVAALLISEPDPSIPWLCLQRWPWTSDCCAYDNKEAEPFHITLNVFDRIDLWCF